MCVLLICHTWQIDRFGRVNDLQSWQVPWIRGSPHISHDAGCSALLWPIFSSLTYLADLSGLTYVVGRRILVDITSSTDWRVPHRQGNYTSISRQVVWLCWAMFGRLSRLC